MVSNRLIALALTAALLQAGILSMKLAAAAGEKNARAPTPRFWQPSPSRQDDSQADAALHCPKDNPLLWTRSDWMAAAPASPYADAAH